ncbi:MAG: diadenylate cyclase, partial [Candidatus Scatosoma sp.]
MATMLLADGNGFLDWAKAAGSFFTEFKAVYVIEIVLLFLLITYVSRTLKENDATKLMAAYWVLIVGVGMLSYWVEILTAQFYLYFLLILSAFMLIMFNVEIKKSLWDSHVGRDKPTDTVFLKDPAPGTESAERCIGDIIRALQNMSKNNVGALVILSKGNMPKQVLQSGVKMDADISTQLIEGVFFPKAPLHDGAMVIKGHKIQAAGCFLPLTQKTNYPKDFGTRHRAGIGITEVANVVSLVVSEETGIISIIKQGNVQRY